MALVHGDPPGLTEIGNLHVTQLDLEAFGSGFSTGEKADVMQHTFALIAEARRPNGGNLQMATQLFHNESGKRLSGDVLCDYQHRPSTFCNLLQQREQTFPGTDCSFVDEDVNVVEGNFHAFGISNKVRREISAIELHAANLWSVAGDARNEAAVADNSSVFHMSQNAVAYCSKLSSHISSTSKGLMTDSSQNPASPANRANSRVVGKPEVIRKRPSGKLRQWFPFMPNTF